MASIRENTPPFQIKFTDTPLMQNYSEISNIPSIAEIPMVTAVPAVVPMSDDHPSTNHGSQKSSKNNKRITKEKVIHVLLDSGSSGDLWFHKKGTPKHFCYLNRLVSEPWNTSNGAFTTKGRGEFSLKLVFMTKGKGEFSLKFFEYSNRNSF
jgi:hypothetical protein